MDASLLWYRKVSSEGLFNFQIQATDTTLNGKNSLIYQIDEIVPQVKSTWVTKFINGQLVIPHKE